MDTRLVCFFAGLSLVMMSYTCVFSLNPNTAVWPIRFEDSSHRIHFVDNDPEFLVGVRGIDKPLCFHMEGPADDVIRLIQDPVSDVMVNARIIHQGPANKTYLGAIMLSQGSTFKILAKQRVVMIDDQKYDWTVTRSLMVRGNRVVIGNDMMAVTFYNHSITLVVRRHFSFKGQVDENEVTASTHSDIDDDNENSNVYENNDDRIDGDEKDDFIPMDSEREIDNRDKFDEFGKRIHQHSERPDEIPFPTRRKRSLDKSHEFQSLMGNSDISLRSSNLHLTMLRRNGDPGAVESKKMKRLPYGRLDPENLRLKHIHSKRANDKTVRAYRDVFTENHMNNQDQSENSKRNGAGERRKDTVIFLGVYISDSTDFSNKTHGLLGQFLYKKVVIEKISYKNAKMKARMGIKAEPSRRIIALLTLRSNAALNSTRACWRVRDHGREVIDGNYQDYLVPSLRYSQMMQLPPHAPL